MTKHPYEFWCITEDGTKFHEYFQYSSRRASKVKEFIEKKYGIDIETCQDFGFRRNHDI
jgi:hypothetical protein